MKIKVCGLTKLDEINKLIDYDIDFLGFIFYEKSPRYVLKHLTLKQIAEINHQKKVGVFVNESIKGIVEIASEAQLDVIQLHGNEDEKFILSLRELIGHNIEIIKVIRIGNQTPDELQKTINDLPKTTDYLLFDKDSKAFGGTGRTFDWNIINDLNFELPYLLSGGISLENIDELNFLRKQPIAVDINSKFEIEPGEKDLKLIKEFINKIKA